MVDEANELIPPSHSCRTVAVLPRQAVQGADRWQLMRNASAAFPDTAWDVLAPIRGALGSFTTNFDLRRPGASLSQRPTAKLATSDRDIFARRCAERPTADGGAVDKPGSMRSAIHAYRGEWFFRLQHLSHER